MTSSDYDGYDLVSSGEGWAHRHMPDRRRHLLEVENAGGYRVAPFQGDFAKLAPHAVNSLRRAAGPSLMGAVESLAEYVEHEINV